MVWHRYLASTFLLAHTPWESKREQRPWGRFGHELENVLFIELLCRGGKVLSDKLQNEGMHFVVQKLGNIIDYYQVAYSVNDGKRFWENGRHYGKSEIRTSKILFTMDDA